MTIKSSIFSTKLPAFMTKMYLLANVNRKFKLSLLSPETFLTVHQWLQVSACLLCYIKYFKTPKSEIPDHWAKPQKVLNSF